VIESERQLVSYITTAIPADPPILPAAARNIKRKMRLAFFLFNAHAHL